MVGFIGLKKKELNEKKYPVLRLKNLLVKNIWFYRFKIEELNKYPVLRSRILLVNYNLISWFYRLIIEELNEPKYLVLRLRILLVKKYLVLKRRKIILFNDKTYPKFSV